MPPSSLPPADRGLPFAPTTNLVAPAGGVRRKTPSELRQEQLNRVVRSRNGQDGTIGALSSLGSTAEQKKNGTRLVDTRVADIFAATKPHERPKFPFSKQKDDFKRALPNSNTEASRKSGKPIEEEPSSNEKAEEGLPGNDGKCVAGDSRYGNFRNVTQLSFKTRPQDSGLAVDMAEALKVMAPVAARGFSGATMSRANIDQVLNSLPPIMNTCVEKLKTPPVDLSLKLSARFHSVDSLHWCHRLSSTNEVEGVKLFVEKFKWNDKLNIGSQTGLFDESGRLDRYGSWFYQALHSWVHPPPQYLGLYDMALTSARGDIKKCGMITGLFRMWEESFRSLYYMFCHKYCNVFYFCAQQFVVMFERGNKGEGDENASNAYWSRSTRGLRKILQDQGVGFSMPFCTSEADVSTLEDLHELTEFEKLNPGQTRLVDSRTAIDNNSQSLLAFEEVNVHRLFDFLLNYRFLVASGNAGDIPVLYSPVEFSKASLYMPEVKCKHMQRSVENISKELPVQNGSHMGTTDHVSDMLYSLELKGPSGAYITPWVIQAVCLVLQNSQKLGFEVSLVTGPLSEALNVAQESSSAAKESPHSEQTTKKSAPCSEEITKESPHSEETIKELPQTVEGTAPSSSRTDPTDVSVTTMRVLKHLKYSEGLYQATFGGLS